MSNEMDFEDYYHQQRAEIAALKEQIDNLIARIRMHEEREKIAAKWREERDRLLAAVDDCLARERGRNELRRQELEAGL
jgi:hypothetical protein